MTVENIELTIREYISDVMHMSLATCSHSKPWVCEVHFAYDDLLNLYFLSKAHSRHSLEISKNNNVAGNIVAQHGQDDKPRGVYFEGRAEMLRNVDDVHPAFVSYDDRFDTGLKILDEAKLSQGHKFYKIFVDNFYLFDSRESKPGQKYKLGWGNKK